MITKKDFLHDEHSQHDACCAQDGSISRRFSSEDNVIIKTVSPLRPVVRISAERRILRLILHNDELWDTKIFSSCMPVLGPEPSQEGRFWATSRVPVGGAAVASDFRVSSCREQSRRRGGTRRMNDVGFVSQYLKTR
ncbi:hypothetical protein AVEN_252591-1 [Araneus ventricosus]|uniref:Uncharacterized protein n=1 Tax=Araneus ventricosus TaxID=182803 RepID=A0A4Y2ARR6_ARAVE|nr:hypothetical protein AVEN_252591-1 [Araneus ventricosus]